MMLHNSSYAVPTLYFAQSGLGLLMSTPYREQQPQFEVRFCIYVCHLACRTSKGYNWLACSCCMHIKTFLQNVYYGILK